EAFARSKGIPVIDLFGYTQNILTNTPFHLGGENIGVDGKTFVGRQLFTTDGVHADPAAHGLMANMFVEAVNQASDAGLQPPGHQQVLLYSRDLPELPAIETYFDVSPYVIVPETSSFLMVGCASLLGLGFMRRRIGSRCA